MPKRFQFNYRTGLELRKATEKLGLDLPWQEDISPLFQSLEIDNKKVPNRLAVHPMEGCDAGPDGSPGKLTFERYARYAAGGSGMIWFEAAAVNEAGRSSPAQLWIHSGNVDTFRSLVEKTREAGREVYGSRHGIFCVLQITHSGRYSRPRGKPLPQGACFNPWLDARHEDIHILSDEELDNILLDFIQAAELAYSAGFDAVDIKSCHGYLINDLLSAYTRPGSRYGGEFKNRSRFLLDAVRKIKRQTPGLLISSRLSGFDGLPFPYGFGFIQEETQSIDLSEVRELIRHLLLMGCQLFNITAGNPHFRPQVSRPFNRPVKGAELPEEHPLTGVVRLIRICGELQQNFPHVPFVGTGYSWLRHFFPYAAAAVTSQNMASLIGLGRSSFAYPEAPHDLMEKERLDPKKVCIACSRCSELLRNQRTTGCAVRGPEIYRNEYRKLNSGGDKNDGSG
jgi:2,4-dienoyl-CoA reductase-like NADH-dependent reductase (Old Yellow Enzyme family)